jgi:hypothetical protein
VANGSWQRSKRIPQAAQSDRGGRTAGAHQGGSLPRGHRPDDERFWVEFVGGFSALFVNDQQPYPDDAVTLPDVSVVRFTISAFVSVPGLARTVFHERVHIQQFLRGDWGRTDSLGDWVNEVEAYDRSDRVADVLGLAGAERQTNAALRTTYYRRLDASYRLRLSGSSHKIKNEDRAPGAPIPSTE